MPKPKDDTAAALARIKVVVKIKSNQSPLYQWMVENYGQFAPIIKSVSRPGWRSVTVELQKLGLRKSINAPLDEKYVRQTFSKVRRAVETQKEKR